MVDEASRTLIEIVSMKADGNLSISETSMMKNVSPGVKVWTASPGSPDFVEFQARHGVKKLGQTSTIRKELRDGVWSETQTKDGDWD